MPTVVLLIGACTIQPSLNYALKSAKHNRSELETFLSHYKKVNANPQKLRAAEFMIENLPAHYSYADTTAINSYYHTALSILGTGTAPDWQRDTLRKISDRDYPGLTRNIVPDVLIMTADYLINNIDHAFAQWKTRPWAQHLTYEEFRDWILPYKVTELQSFDYWRDVLSSYYSDSISTVPPEDIDRNSIYGAIEKAIKDLSPTDWQASWKSGECATWALLYIDNYSHINSGKEKNRIINALCGNDLSYSVSSETMAIYNQSVAAGGFSKSEIISASVKLGLNLEEVTFNDLGIDRHNANKSLSRVIMSTGNHVIVPLRYKRKSDKFEYRDIYTGASDTSLESADNISYSLGKKKTK